MDNQENKFNFSEEEEKKHEALENAKKDAAVEESKKAVTKDAKGLFQNIKKGIISGGSYANYCKNK